MTAIQNPTNINAVKNSKGGQIKSLIFGGLASAIFCQPAFAGCACNALASYIDCGGTIMSVSFVVSAFLMFRRNDLTLAKKMVLAGASLITLSVLMSTSLNSNLWYSSGVIANSEAWLEGGFPAHWISLLIIAILFALLFICCSVMPTIVAYRRKQENRRSMCNMNLMIVLIPGAFVMAPFLFFDSGSYFVMTFWRTLFTEPAQLSEIPSRLYFSIAVWSVLLGIFAWAWSKLLVDACEPGEVVVEVL